MKKPLIVMVSLLLLGTAFSTKAQQLVSFDSTVASVKGNTRWTTNGQNWLPAQLGDLIPAGSTLQTSSNASTDIFLGEYMKLKWRPLDHSDTTSFKPRPRACLLHLYPNAVVKLDEVTGTSAWSWRSVATRKEIKRVKLELRSGQLMAIIIQKTSSPTMYEMEFLDHVIRTTHGSFILGSKVAAESGSLTILKKNGEAEVELQSGNSYDLTTGEISPLTDSQHKLFDFNN